MAKGYGKIGETPQSGGNMKAQVQALQKQMQEQQAKIAEMETTTTVGGGAIKITMTGDQVCKSVVIDPEFLKDSDAETLQDILLSGLTKLILAIIGLFGIISLVAIFIMSQGSSSASPIQVAAH